MLFSEPSRFALMRLPFQSIFNSYRLPECCLTLKLPSSLNCRVERPREEQLHFNKTDVGTSVLQLLICPFYLPA